MWNDLSMADRARYIQIGVANGITSLDNIRTAYNTYADGGPIYNKKDRKWYNSRGEALTVGHGYYSKAINKYVMYGTDGTVTKYSPIEWAEKKHKDTVTKRKELERQYAIPAKNRVTLTQTGVAPKDRGAQVSQEQVDSILKYANIVGLNNYEALGLAAQESTFNKNTNPINRNVGLFYDTELPNNKWAPILEKDLLDKASPVLMTSDWGYINDNPYISFLNEVNKEKDPIKREEKAKAGRRYMEKQAAKFNVNVPPLQHSFELFKSGKYNTNDKNHTHSVRARGNALKNSPEMVEMVNKSKFR